MKPRSRWISVLAVLASCLLIAACGGGDSKSSSSSGGGSSSGSSSSSASTATLSKDELIKQGEKICQAGSDKIDKLGESPSDPAKLTAYTDKLTAIVSATVADMRKLKPPADLATDYNKLIELMAKVGEDSAALTTAAKNQDVSKLTAITKDLEKVANDGQAVAKRIGFTGACTG